ncbi:MAG: PRC-barrel domain-containing protein [Solirubrobacteraceae bacterium]
MEAHTPDSIDTNEANEETTAAAPQDNPEATATEPAVLHREIAEWHGRDLVDRDGERIGKLEEVYFDIETDEPQFGTVKEGFIGRHLTFVPLTGITIGPNNLQVPVSKQQVKDAPNIELQGGELSQADESALYHHYQLNYTPPDNQTGRRLARR